MMEKPITDAAILRLYAILTDILPAGVPMTEALEKRQQQEKILWEIKQAAKLNLAEKLAQALELPTGNEPLSDSDVARLYNALIN
jgi:hypothetical protein